MDKVTIATLMISIAAGTTHASDSSITTIESKSDVETISLLRTKKGDIILMEDGNKVVGLLDGDPKLCFSFGEIIFPKNDIAMILQDIDDPERIHIVTTSGQSYVGSPVKESIRAYSINEDQTKNELDSFIALLPEKSNGVFQPDDSPLYSIRFNNGDRLTAVILDQNIHIKDGYKTTTISPQQIVKLSKNEGIQIQNRRNVERKFGSYISDKYLTVVIPASDQHFKLQWDLIDKVQKYDPMYDEETFEAIATVLKPLYKNVHRNGVWTAELNDKQQYTQETNELAGIKVNSKRLEFDSVGYSNNDVSHVAVNIEDKVEVIADVVDYTANSEEVAPSVESDEIVVNISDHAEPLFVDEQDFEISDEIVVTDFVYEEVFIAESEDGKVIEVSHEISVIDEEKFAGDQKNLLVENNQEFVAENTNGNLEDFVDMNVIEKLVAEYFVTEENFLANFQEIGQLFDEALDFEVSEELVITDFESDDFMLAESEEVSAPDVVSESIIEDKELLAGDPEEVNVDEIDELIAESDLDAFEQLFDETLEFDVSEELVITDFESDDFMLAESEEVSAPDVVSESIIEDEELLAGDPEEVNVDEIDELIAESDLDAFEQLFDETLDFDVSEELVMIESVSDDFMLAESEEVSAPDAVNESIIEDEELLAGDPEEVNVDEIDELIAERDLDAFEQLFDETLDFDVIEELVMIESVSDDFMLAESEEVSAPDAVNESIIEDEELLAGDPEEINVDEIDELIAESNLDVFEQLFDETLDFDVIEELVMIESVSDDFMLAESEEVSAPDVVSESIIEDEELLAGDPEEINVDEIDELIAESNLDAFEQLFDETLDFDVIEELVMTDSVSDDFMLAESEEVSAPDVVSESIIEDEELLAADPEEVNADELDELIAESSPEDFEKLFIEALNFEVSDGMDDLIALNEDVISKGISQEVIDELHEMLMSDEEIEEISDGQEVDVAESEVIELSVIQENDEILPKELLDKLGIILSDGWSDNPVSEDKISAGFVVIGEQLIEIDNGSTPYIIGKNLVTNSEYNEFAQATGHKRPSNWQHGKVPENQANRPVTDVSKEDAEAYASWKKKRLPTREEIETALELGIIVNDENVSELLDSSAVETSHDSINAPKGFRLAEDIKPQ
jgi:Sulfatase-modifying factor enzyme 1